MQRPIFLICVWCILVTPLHAQQVDARYPKDKEVFPFGVVEHLDSKALNEKRSLNIYLPQGYHPDSVATYPTIYVLDGSAHEDFPHIAGLAQFMNMYSLLPHAIVVGIANVDRYRDFTYPSNDPEDKKHLPTQGGSAAFIRFLETEVQPFIQQHYKTNDHQTLIGQSMGGLLATEVLLKSPQLFDDYIIVSPSLWWDQQKMINDINTYLQAQPNMQQRIAVALGKEHPVMHEVADKLVAALREQEKLTVFYQTMPEENHATILHRAVYWAFEQLHPQPKEKQDE